MYVCACVGGGPWEVRKGMLIYWILEELGVSWLMYGRACDQKWVW